MQRSRMGCLIVLLVILVVGSTAFVLFQIDERNRQTLEAQLTGAIVQYEQGENACVDFAKATFFAWDSLYFFGPYRSAESIDAVLGRYWLGARFSPIGSSDNIVLLVFTNQGRIVQHIELYRMKSDFATSDIGKGYNIDQACFVENEQGKMVPRNNQ